MESNSCRLPSPRSLARRRLAYVAAPALCLLALLGVWSLTAGRPPELAPELAPDRLAEPALLSAAGSVSAQTDAGSAGIKLASHEVAGATTSETDLDPEAAQRARALGTWEDDYHGKRRLTVREDGTATMVVEPSGIGRKLFAERLQFEIEWSLADGKIVMTTTSGEPKSKAQLVLKLYGNKAEYSVLDLNAGQMLLLDADGKTRYEWRRVEDERAP